MYFWRHLLRAFLTARNIVNLLSRIAAPIMIIAIGEVLLLICGEIDLSVGFIFAFSPFLMHYLIDYYGVPAVLAIILSLLMGGGVGWVNGFLTVTLRAAVVHHHARHRVHPLGLVLTTSHAYPANIPPSARRHRALDRLRPAGRRDHLGRRPGRSIFQIVLSRTRWGLHTVAVGGNLLGAPEAGINVARIKYGNFMITGFMGALVGLQDGVPRQHHRPERGRLHADVLRGRRRGHRRHGDARRHRARSSARSSARSCSPP